MRKYFSTLLLGVGLVLSITISQASVPAAGTYRCASYNVSGGGGSCRTMQPLVLRADNTYQYSSTKGRWSEQGDMLYLSASRLWGPGRILGSDTIRFEYDYRGWRHTVTWVCQECGGTGKIAPTSGMAAAQGGYASVSLTLEFETSVGGVSGFTIVPVGSATGYTHNAALPEGAVQGLAWELSATTVALATNRSNKLRRGRQYVVFLAWPRETLPVASFDLRADSGDYQATLPASLRYVIPAPSAAGFDAASSQSRRER